MTRLPGLWPSRCAGGFRGFSTGHPCPVEKDSASMPSPPFGGLIVQTSLGSRGVRRTDRSLRIACQEQAALWVMFPRAPSPLTPALSPGGARGEGAGGEKTKH